MSENIPHNPLEGKRPELNISLDNYVEDMVSIVIVHKDRPEYLNLLLQSIVVNTHNNNYEIIVSDNNSEQSSQDFLDEIEEGNVKVVRNKENLWWSEAANKGVEVSDKNSKYIVFLHHDVIILNPSWLDMMINVSLGNKSGLIGLEMSSYYIQNSKADFIQEWCMLMTRECWNQIGPWPKELPQIGNSFILTAKAQRKGFSPQVMNNNIVHHNRIFAMDVSEYERMVENAMITIPKLLREIYS